MGFVSLLFSFKGRVNRSQYWLVTIGVNLVNWVVMAMMSVGNIMAAQGKTPGAALSAMASQNAILFPLSIAVGWAALAVQVKRFHDRGQSGLWTLLPIAPVVFAIMNVVTGIMDQWPPERLFGSLGMPLLALLVISLGFFVNLGCLAGTDGPNKYGDPPGNGGRSFTPAAPSSPKPNAAAAAASSLFSAQSAIDRAVEERARAQAQPAPAAAARAPAPAAPRAPSPMRPTPVAVPAGAGSFGRRPTSR